MRDIDRQAEAGADQEGFGLCIHRRVGVDQDHAVTRVAAGNVQYRRRGGRGSPIVLRANEGLHLTGHAGQRLQDTDRGKAGNRARAHPRGGIHGVATGNDVDAIGGEIRGFAHIGAHRARYVGGRVQRVDGDAEGGADTLGLGHRYLAAVGVDQRGAIAADTIGKIDVGDAGGRRDRAGLGAGESLGTAVDQRVGDGDVDRKRAADRVKLVQRISLVVRHGLDVEFTGIDGGGLAHVGQRVAGDARRGLGHRGTGQQAETTGKAVGTGFVGGFSQHVELV